MRSGVFLVFLSDGAPAFAMIMTPLKVLIAVQPGKTWDIKSGHLRITFSWWLAQCGALTTSNPSRSEQCSLLFSFFPLRRTKKILLFFWGRLLRLSSWLLVAVLWRSNFVSINICALAGITYLLSKCWARTVSCGSRSVFSWCEIVVSRQLLV